MGRMIRITEEYRIAPNKEIALRHICQDAIRLRWSMYGSPIGQTSLKDKSKRSCWACGEPTPKKILFIFNLWKWHND